MHILLLFFFFSYGVLSQPTPFRDFDFRKFKHGKLAQAPPKDEMIKGERR